MELIKFSNTGHLGDCLPCIHLLNKIAETTNKKISFSCHPNYCLELENFVVDKEKISINTRIGNDCVNLWGYPKEIVDYSLPFPHHKNFSDAYPHLDSVGKMLFKIYEYRCQQAGVEYPFKTISDIIYDEEIFNKPITEKYDYLVINSYCLSGQMKMSNLEQDLIFEQFINRLIQNNKTFITTKRLKDHPCTDRSLLGIGQLSKNVKTVIGVPTSPFFPCINKFAIDNGVKYVNFTHDCCTFDYSSNFTTIHDLEKYNIE